MGKIPILGVCMGHECMVEVFGAKIVHCGEVKHGKVSLLTHDHKVEKF
jgi:anthranilate/para-aminobenzoate synthase component II